MADIENLNAVERMLYKIFLGEVITLNHPTKYKQIIIQTAATMSISPCIKLRNLQPLTYLCVVPLAEARWLFPIKIFSTSHIYEHVANFSEGNIFTVFQRTR